jgi:excisionase family DNA binding protein
MNKVTQVAELPRRYTEQQVADMLEVSVDTVRRERHRGKLGYLRIGRRIFITENHVRDYLERQSVEPCPSESALPKSAAIGSANAPIPMPGAEPGLTPLPDRHAASRLAQATFGKPS